MITIINDKVSLTALLSAVVPANNVGWQQNLQYTSLFPFLLVHLPADSISKLLCNAAGKRSCCKSYTYA